MAVKVVVNNRPVHPFLGVILGLGTLLLALGLVAAALLVVLPFVGVVVAFSIGLVSVVLIAVGVLLVALGFALPLLIAGASLAALLRAPFHWLKRKERS